MKDVFKFILDNWILLAPLVYEILARLWPTKWNVSILDNLWSILNKIIPNLRKPQPTDEMVSTTKNKVVVDTKKHILKTLLALFLFSITLTSQAQTWQAYKGIWLKKYDTLSSVPAIPAGYGAFVATNNGLFGYDTAWFNLRDTTGGGGITNTAGVNELMKSDGTNAVPSGIFSGSSSNIQLGTVATSPPPSGTGFRLQVLTSGLRELDLNATDNVYMTTLKFNMRTASNILFTISKPGGWLLQPEDTATSTGADVTISADDANTSTANGGNLILKGGSGNAGGTNGTVVLTSLPDVALKASLPVGAIYDSLSYIKRKH